MIYLERIYLPTQDQEWEFHSKGSSVSSSGTPVASWETKRDCYSSRYPFGILSSKGLTSLSFTDVTILCGNNGSGKSTLLNVIANKLGLKRSAPYNRSAFYEDYLAFCDVEVNGREEYNNPGLENVSRIITSDDVFEYMLQLRSKNEEMDFRRKQMLRAHADANAGRGIPVSLDFDDPESIKSFRRANEMRRKSGSKYVRDNLGLNQREYSNGESGYQYFVDAILPGGLYLLDEPENSLAADLQIELAKLIPGMARHFECQFIISTHSPFLLAIPGATVYDMDANPVVKKPWTRLGCVTLFRQFFMDHEAEFPRPGR